MESGRSDSVRGVGSGTLLLAIDTCGPMGSVALGRFVGGEGPMSAGRDIEVLGETELEGRSYSSTLVMAVGDLLKNAGAGLKDLGAIVAVHGPGSFTGVRVGLSAVKGLAEPTQIPVVVVSRLEVLAAKAGVEVAALDAHRGEVFLRVGGRAKGLEAAGPNATGRNEIGKHGVVQRAAKPTEMLAGAAELKAFDPAPAEVAVCDLDTIEILAAAWPSTELLHAVPPTAADALRLAAARVAQGAIVDIALADVALLDGNYLRRSDAEIFGEAKEARRR
jgi:tRNA threonylcarbamoyladenosine biosynthesis protein TsaB